MALRFIDGFDHYSFAQILRKWNASNGTHTISTSGARTGLSLTFATSSANHIFKFLDNQATWIIGFACKFPTIPTAGNKSLVTFLDGASDQLNIKFTSAINTLEARRGGVAGTLLGTTSSGIPTNTWCYIEIKVTINSTTGVVVIKIDGTTVLNLTGQNTQSTANAYVNSVLFNNHGSFTSGAQVAWLIDDLYICDGTNSGVVPNNDFLGNCKVETLLPSGAGNYSQFSRGGADSGNNYGQVDENPATDDTDYVYSNTVNQIDTYNFGNLSSTPAAIFGIQLNNTMRKDDAGSRMFAPLVRISGTDYVLTTDTCYDNYYLDLQIKEISPATSAAWTGSEIDAAEFGVKLIS